MSTAEDVKTDTTKEEAESVLLQDLKEKEALLNDEHQRVRKDAEHKQKVAEARRALAEHHAKLKKEDPDLADANKTILKHAAAAAAAAAVVPVPMLDLTAAGAVQFKLLADLAKIFNVPLSEHAGKAAIGAMVGSLGTGTYLTGTVLSLIKVIPILGHTAGILALPAITFASTYALGKVFTVHFASGGNLLNFDPISSRAAYQQYYKEGKGLAPGSIRPQKK